MDSHSEKQCSDALVKQANKRKLTGIGDSKPGKEGMNLKRRRSFKRFKQDLEQVVLKGRNTEDLRYVMEVDNREQVFASYLLMTFGDFAEAHSVDGHTMADCAKVFKARYSSEGQTKISAEEHLKLIHACI